MKRLVLSMKAAALAFLVAAGAAWLAGASAADTLLYNGEAAASVGLVLGGWGGGLAEETTQEKLDGDRCLKIRIRDLYQGGRLQLQRPIDLAQVARQPNAYLAVTLKMTGTARQFTVNTSGSTGGGGMGGAGMGGAGGAGMGGAGGGGMGGGGMGGGRGGGGMGGGMGGAGGGGMGGGGRGGGGGRVGGTGSGAGGSVNVVIPPIKRLRVVFVGENGKTLEAYSLGEMPPAEGGWTTVGIPLDKLAPHLTEGAFPVKSILLSADSPDTVFVARLRLVNDNSRLDARINVGEIGEIRAGVPTTFSASVDAGLTPVKVSWDFDAQNGVQEEATGKRVIHTFQKPGRYTITMTARPEDGAQKQPVVETLEVEVVP